MTKRKVLDEKPYAGNSHVRFEGEVASATPSLMHLLYKKFARMIAVSLVAVLTLGVYAGNQYTIGEYTYNYAFITQGGATIRPYSGGSHFYAAVSPMPSGEYVIPSHLPDADTNWWPVVGISEYTRGNYSVGGGSVSRYGKACGSSTMTVITIPDTVEYIGITAFADCTALESIKLPAALNTINDYAFANCSKIERFEFGENLVRIGNYAFSNCTRLREVVFRDGLESIGESAFSSCVCMNWYNLTLNGLPCTNLETITLPQTVTNIGKYAFANCIGLRSADIKGGMIGYGSFSGCSALESVSLGGNVTHIGNYAFHGDVSLSEMTVPGNVTAIGHQAFQGCSNMVRLVIGDGVKSIGNYAFASCTSLKEVVLPDSLESLGTYAFAGCTNLTSITFGGGLRYIPERLCDGCTALREVNISNCITNIGQSAFYRCVAMGDLVIPDNVVSIGQYAFWGCSSMTNVSFGTGLKSVGEYAFYGCNGLEKVNAASLAAWCGISFADYSANPIYYSQNLFVGGELVTSLDLGEGICAIGRYTFVYYSKLAHVSTGDSVTNICGGAFYGCTELETIELGKNLKVIGNSAFSFCSGLSSITIPDKVTEIGDSAFYSCDGITSMTIPDGVRRIGASAFASCRNLRQVAIGGNVSVIGSEAFRYCEKLQSVEIADLGSWCRIVFDGAWSNPSSYARRLDMGGNPLGDVVLPSDLTNVAAYAFYSVTNLTSVTVPASVESLGVYSFHWCQGLTNIVFEGNAPSCDSSSTFQGCSSCTVRVSRVSTGWNATIPGTWRGMRIEYIGQDNGGGSGNEDPNPSTGEDDTQREWYYTENEDGSINIDFVIPIDSVLAVPESVDGKTVTGISPNAFQGCTNIVKVILPPCLTSIGESSFAYCLSLAEIKIPAGVTNIGMSAFAQCTSLRCVTMLGAVPAASNSIYSGCDVGLMTYVTSAWNGPRTTWLGYNVSVVGDAEAMVNGTAVTISGDWIAKHIDMSDVGAGILAADLDAIAANGTRSVAECYLLGVDPDREDDDFKITSFDMVNGEPVFTLNHTSDGSGVSFVPRIRKLGKAALGDAWQEVPSGGNPAFRFFTVEVCLP